MQTINKLVELRSHLRSLKMQGKTIAMVATMGNLHEGHIDLIHKAKTLADVDRKSVV